MRQRHRARQRPEAHLRVRLHHTLLQRRRQAAVRLPDLGQDVERLLLQPASEARPGQRVRRRVVRHLQREAGRRRKHAAASHPDARSRCVISLASPVLAQPDRDVNRHRRAARRRLQQRHEVALDAHLLQRQPGAVTRGANHHPAGRAAVGPRVHIERRLLLHRVLPGRANP
jgi:hypothetical protein